MKKITLLICLLLVQFILLGQKDSALERRLAEFMQVNDVMDLNKVLDYTYPKLYTIVPRDQMLEVLQNTFENENMSIQLDSLHINTIYPVFNLENGSYAKVIYSMNMLMAFKNNKEDSLTPEKKKDRDDFLLSSLSEQYGAGNVSIDPVSGYLKIKMVSPMVAVKDEYAKQWSFVNFKENDPVTNRLFSKEILKKMATYK